MTTVNATATASASRPLPAAPAGEVEAALAYERIFVPALFAEWPAHLIRAAEVRAGHRVLDVACGTGVVTRALLPITGEAPAPAGLDLSPGMLEVARRLSPSADWHHGDAQALPFADALFDRVLCQFGLMFFADRVAALRQMHRVLAPGGRLALAVWGSLERNPGFAEKVAILDAVGGTPAGDALRAPFCLGNEAALAALLDAAGFGEVTVTAVAGAARFASMADFVEAEVRGWLPVMDVHLTEDQIRTVHAECRVHLAGYQRQPSGELELPTEALVVSARA